MGQAAQRRKTVENVNEHLKTLGRALLDNEPEPQDTVQWLQSHFVAGLLQAAKAGATTWQNQLYLKALGSTDAALRRGIVEVMNNVMTAGLEAGHTVFALVAHVTLPKPEVVGLFETCEPLEAWVAAQLKVPRHNLRMHYTAMHAPAHAGLFSLMTSLQTVTRAARQSALKYAAQVTEEEPHAKPKVQTRSVKDPAQTEQTLMFLVSVFTDRVLDLSQLTPTAGNAPVFELTYWGTGSEGPVDKALVQPAYPELAFESLQQLGGFRQSLDAARNALAPLRPAGPKPTLEVVVRYGTDFRFKQGTAVFARWQGVDMPEIHCYSGSFSDHFVPQLERLDVTLQRAPGVQPTLFVPLTEEDFELDFDTLEGIDISATDRPLFEESKPE